MIREASLDDSSHINRLSWSLGYQAVSDDLAKTRLQLALQSSNDKIWVFEKDSQVLGWIHAFIAHRVASAPFVEIGGLAVDPMNLKQGVGRRLVEQTKLWARERKLSLRVRCNSERSGTHKFYEAVGFSKTKNQNVFEFSL